MLAYHLIHPLLSSTWIDDRLSTHPVDNWAALLCVLQAVVRTLMPTLHRSTLPLLQSRGP